MSILSERPVEPIDHGPSHHGAMADDGTFRQTGRATGVEDDQSVFRMRQVRRLVRIGFGQRPLVLLAKQENLLGTVIDAPKCRRDAPIR